MTLKMSENDTFLVVHPYRVSSDVLAFNLYRFSAPTFPLRKKKYNCIVLMKFHFKIRDLDISGDCSSNKYKHPISLTTQKPESLLETSFHVVKLNYAYS